MHFAFCRSRKAKRSRIPSMIGEYGFFFFQGSKAWAAGSIRCGNGLEKQKVNIVKQNKAHIPSSAIREKWPSQQIAMLYN